MTPDFDPKADSSPTRPLAEPGPVRDQSSAPTNPYDEADFPKRGQQSADSEVAQDRPLMPGDLLTGRRDGKHTAARYQLISLLGQGGFGMVWRAQVLPDAGINPGIPQEVAIKVFSSPYGMAKSDLKNRELSAMLAVHKLSTDRVPKVYDWAIGAEVEFVVMQYCTHGSLHELRYRKNRVDEATAWRLLVDLLTAIKHAHSADILHLDVKPANVLLDGSGGFMLTDFGISQGNFVTSRIQYPGLGTPRYRAPEQADRDEELIGSRSDLYGVGSTVWAVFCGFDLSSKNCPDVYAPKSDWHALPSPKRYVETASDGICEVLLQLVARAPDHRPGGAAEALQLIEEKRNNRPPSVSSSSITRRIRGYFDRAVPAVLDNMIDPLWQFLLRELLEDLKFARFDDGEFLCVKDEKSYNAFLLLSGTVRVLSDGHVLAEESREGTFIGEVATLTGKVRTADVQAVGQVWTCVFNAAELERFIMCNPAVAIRMVRTLAMRVSSHAEVSDQLRRSRDSV